MENYNIAMAQQNYAAEEFYYNQNGIVLTEQQQAVSFAKILIRQNNGNVVFCNDRELFVSKTPAGYDVVGYFIDAFNVKKPFNITVNKVNNLWYPAKRYVAADTKAGSNYILIFILISIGCSLMGLLSYFLISAFVGL